MTLTLPLVALSLGVGLFGCAKAPPPAPRVAAVIPPTPEVPAQNAPVCVRPPEKAAFEMSTLKSHLTVTAIQCHAEERYNAFVMKYRPDLVGGEKVLTSYFARAYGKRAQSQHDDYITQLANAQSQFAVRSGNLYCPQNIGLFDEVMTVKAGSELPAFAQSKPIQQAIAVQDCPSTPPPATKAAVKPAAKPAVKKP
jgi:hypothetical protein